MKKKWKNIEDKLNLWLENLIQAFKSRASRNTPGKLKNFAQKTKSKKTGAQEKFSEKAKSLVAPLVSFFKDFRANIQKVTNKIQAGLIQFSLKMRKVDPKDMTLEKIGIALSALLLPYVKKLQVWLNSLKPTTIAKFVTVSTASSLTALSLIGTGDKIQDESQKREPAQIEKVERVNKGQSRKGARPEYFKQEKRFLKIYSFRLPIMVDNAPNPESKYVKADFTIVTSNRYTRNYLFKNRHMVQDQLNTFVNATVPKFPLEEEGKAILKEKIKGELDRLIHDLQIEGEVEDVHITSILEV